MPQSRSLYALRVFVVAVVVLVAGWDLVMGGVLLSSSEPWLWNGQAPRWLALPADLRANEAVRAFAIAIERRCGAFSIFSSVVTFVWLALSRRAPHLRTALLVTYIAAGPVFFGVDQAFFRGTSYFVVKQIFGALWALALVAQLWSRTVERRRTVATSSSSAD